MRKRLLTALLTLAFSLVLVLPASASEPGLWNFQRSTEEYPPYTDVNEGSWYYTIVEDARALGLMQGRADGSFDPEGNVTLAETLALACRLNDIYNGGSGVFEQGAPWFQVYVDAATERGIWTGDAETDYDAYAPRWQFASLLCVSLAEEALAAIKEVEYLPDVPEDAPYAEAVLRLYRAGVLTGNDEYGTFLPDSPIRRSEVAAIVARMADPALRKSASLQPEPYSSLLRHIRQTGEDYLGQKALRSELDGDAYLLCAAPTEHGWQLRLRIYPDPAELDGYSLYVELRFVHDEWRTDVIVTLEDGYDAIVEQLYAGNDRLSTEFARLLEGSFWSRNPLTPSNERAMRRAMQNLAEYYARCGMVLVDDALRSIGFAGVTDLGFPG